MATSTRVLDANVNGTVYTTNANSALEAIDTCHSGVAAPTNELANGKLWLDTTTTPGILKIYNNAAWEVVHHGADITVTGAFTSLGIDDNAAATAVTIAASGNVGIGAAVPDTTLSVNGAGVTLAGVKTQMTVQGTGALTTDEGGAMTFATDSTSFAAIKGASVAGAEASYMSFFTRPSAADMVEAMRVDSGGSLLVNRTVTDRAAKIRVDLASATNGAAVYISRLGGTVSKAQIEFANDNGVVGSISTSGSATSYNTSSDYRLKENIAPVQGAADIVKAMRPVTYNFKADSTDWHDGFLAHELQELHPRAVIGSKDAVGEDGNPEYQGVDYSKLTPILTAALQEALNKIDALEARVAALEI